MPQKPYITEVEPKVYAWCSCGLSKQQPYCDGKHKGTKFKPIVERITERKTVAWCGCKRTKIPPYCDGSHNHLDI